MPKRKKRKRVKKTLEVEKPIMADTQMPAVKTFKDDPDATVNPKDNKFNGENPMSKARKAAIKSLGMQKAPVVDVQMPVKPKKYGKSVPEFVKELEDDIDSALPPEALVKAQVDMQGLDSMKKLIVGKNQKRPTTHQIHMFTRQIDAEMRMMLKRGVFDDAKEISLVYTRTNRGKK